MPGGFFSPGGLLGILVLSSSCFHLSLSANSGTCIGDEYCIYSAPFCSGTAGPNDCGDDKYVEIGDAPCGGNACWFGAKVKCRKCDKYCTGCDAGSYLEDYDCWGSEGANTCVQCEIGKYKSGHSYGTSCQSCSEGYWSTTVGATSCTECIGTTDSNDEGTECVLASCDESTGREKKGTSCFQVFSGTSIFFDYSETRDDAETACNAWGGHLATIKSDEENDFLKNKIASLGVDRVWIGLNDKAVEGAYEWYYGSLSSYTNWKSGEPNDWNNNEDCTELKSNGEWNDNACSVTRGYVCSATWCDGSVYDDNKCFKLFDDDEHGRGNAQNLCEAWGGNLATIESQGENDFVKDLAGGHKVWIGLNDQDSEGTYVWQDGSLSSYTNWKSGEPNDWNNNEDCTEMYSNGEWNDQKCTGAYRYFVCSKI